VGTGSERLLVDTAQGFKEWADLIYTTLDEHGITLSHVLLTHWHGDHTGGVPDLIRLYPHLTQSIYKHSPTEGQRPLVDGEKVTVEGATIRVVHGAGHSHDHVCFVLEEENALFSGDNILGHGSTAVEHLGDYLQTLRKLETGGFKTGYPGHGDLISKVGEKISRELTVKERREKTCLNALGRLRDHNGRGGLSSASVKELVVAMHGKHIEANVREKALEPFTEEILRKLVDDGKVAFHLRAGVRRWFLID
jgi:glyoxylase-like metal-dependent hydrolase (beta-lactamase superfamily II)